MGQVAIRPMFRRLIAVELKYERDDNADCESQLNADISRCERAL